MAKRGRGRVFICRTSKSGLKCSAIKSGKCPPGCKSSKKRKSRRKTGGLDLRYPPLQGLSGHRRRRR